MEMDTGAAFSIISRETYKRLFRQVSYRKVTFDLKLVAEINYETQNMSSTLLVAGEKGRSLLGRDWLSSLQLDWRSIMNLQYTSLQSILQQNCSIFKGDLGTLKDFKRKYLCVDHNAKPFAIRFKVDAELDRLVEQKIIEPITFSDWAAPIVIVIKSDKSSTRKCGDFKVTVNKVSQLDRYPIPRIEELFAQLAGGKVFTKLDLSQAYQHIVKH